MPASADFVLNNLRYTLYHELGHALIDQYRVPIFGPEENAADSFGFVYADRVHDETEMADLIRDVVRLGRAEAAEELFDPWSEYMPGNQRTARAICLYFGLNPGERGHLARALGMRPDDERFCIEAATSNRRAWEAVLEQARPVGGAPGTLVSSGQGKALRLLAPDIERINRTIALPRRTPLTVETCGQDNAYYYHYDDRMVICSEMEDVLRTRARQP